MTDATEDVSPRSAPNLDLAGRTALVTGGSRGIGKAIAAELLARGANVAITARKREPLVAAAAELGDSVLAVDGNAGDPEHRRTAVAKTVETFGSLDILVNNTGINPVYGSLMDADLAGVSKIFDTNVVGTLGFVQQAFHAWMGEHGGAIVNIASVAGIRSTGVIAAYGASKAALIRLTEELAWQLGPKIRINAVAPGVVKTKFAEALVANGEDATSSGFPSRFIG